MGSIIVGKKETIERARRHRQKLGGGVHKSGVMAAAGLVALRAMPQRIPDDHRRAARLGSLLSNLKPLRPAYPVYTNTVDLFYEAQAMDGDGLVAGLAERGIGITGPWDSPNGKWLRLVTHHGIADEDVEEAAEAFGELVV